MNYNIKNNTPILVIGDVMLDHYITGECNRISPEAPVPVIEVRAESYTLGGAGNVVKNLSAFNCNVDMICVVGNDINADIIISKLSEYNVSSDGIVVDNNRCTTIKTRVLAANHQLIRLDREETTPISAEIEQEVLNLVNRLVENYQVVLLSDYNKGVLTKNVLSGIIDICRKKSIRTIVDPKGTDFSKYKGVNIIKPNKKEATLSTGIVISDIESLQKACTMIKEITNCDDVVVTMSEDGIALYSDDKLKIIPTKALDVVDVTGAGDTVLASLGVAIAAGNSLGYACDFANHAAAVVVNKIGSATATLEEINGIFFA